jgi:hypothetical protein
MNGLRVIWHLMKADVRERTRRYSFLVTMVASVYLAYAVYADDVVIDLDHHRGVYNSAWLGIVLTMSATLFVSLVGFFIIKNTIQRDRLTRVGEVLATTPIRKVEYVLGKTLSNFAVLMLIIAVQALAALVMQVFKSEGGHADIPALLSPFLFIAAPAMMFLAALAVFFESVPGLRGGLGNVVYVFVWAFMLAYPAENKITVADLSFLRPVQDSMEQALRPLYSDYNGGFSLSAGGMEKAGARGTFVWEGMHWTAQYLWIRAGWFAYAFVLALLASLFFDRFDSAKRSGLERLKRRASAAEEAAPKRRKMPSWSIPVKLTFRAKFPQLVLAEFRLAVKGLPYWWYMVALGLVIASIASPLDVVREFLLPALWLWPIMQWSAMGVRETVRRTDQMLFSSPGVLSRQFPAMLLSGILLALILAGGVAVRLAAAGEWGALSGLAAGAVFIPSLALSLGVWSGGSKTFEAVYTFLWYLGPIQKVPEFDYIGVSPTALAAGMPPYFAVVAAGLIMAAFAGRRRQMLIA